MTTIVVNVDREDTTLYADKQCSVNYGRFAYNTNKIIDYGHYKVAFTGEYAYIPPTIDPSFLSDNPESLFRHMADWYVNHMKGFKEDRTANHSPLTIIALNTYNGKVYSNILGAHFPIEMEFGVYAFGGGEEYAQGYLNAVQYFSDIEYHHIDSLYTSISKLGYGTSAEFDCIKVDRKS